MEVLTASDLRAKMVAHKKSEVHKRVQPIYSAVINAAKIKTSLIFDVDQMLRGERSSSYEGKYVPSVEEIVKVLKQTFIDCMIEYTEVWEETTPGVKQKKTGIFIDWS